MSERIPSAMIEKSEHSAQTLMLIDGHAQAYRSFFAIRELKSRTGQPANAVFGFFKSLISLMAQHRPSHLAVIWDGGLDAKRVALHPAYKAQRPPMPESLDSQIDAIAEGLRSGHFATWMQEGVEADDWISKAAVNFAEQHGHVLISSSDKDFMQLVSDRVHLIKPGQEAGSTFGPAEVLAKTGVQPQQIVDWLSLMGDSVDGIPGVPSVGPKTASDLLRKYGTLQEILNQTGTLMPERLRHAIVSHASSLGRNQELIALRTEIPVPVDFKACDLGQFCPVSWRGFCAQWGFNSLARGFDTLSNEREQPELCLT
ncbi:MAG: 5'-3' exonuclease [Verrucomicrobia bacterium]|nr:5'-3' exonuclease [Verrucomicrobiota bacterium]